MTIKRALREIQGIKEVEGDATTKKITVQWGFASDVGTNKVKPE